MIPIASFTYLINSSNLLNIQFTDQSTNSPISWAWDFGFTPNGTSTVQNPVATFPEPKTYRVKLIATNADGASIPYDFDMSIGGNPIGISISELIQQNAPAGFSPDPNFLLAQIHSWQLLLNPSLPIPLTGGDIYNEVMWPPLYNFLIAKLVVYQWIVMVGQNTILGLMQTSTAGLSSFTAKGPVKRIETGPSNAEWYNLADYWASIFKAAASGHGILDLIKEEICMLAGSLGIALPFCPPIITTEPFIVFRPGFGCFSPAVTLPLLYWIKPPSISLPPYPPSYPIGYEFSN